MFLLITVVLSYILSFKLLAFFRKETFDEVVEKINSKLEEDEEIIKTGFCTNGIINISSFLFAFSSWGIFLDDAFGYHLFFITFMLSLIFIFRHFKQVIVLTNKSVFFSYGKEPQIEKISIKNIANSKYIWCFRPFLDIKLKNGELKVISHMTNCDEISNKITELVSKI